MTASYTAIPQSLPKSGNTIRSWILNSFDKHKESLKIELQNAPYSIDFSFDLWTSNNGLAIIGIVGHWVSSAGMIHHGLLSMKKIQGAHSGNNQAALIIDMLTEYDLFHKIGYFTLDNATSNDSALRIIGEELQSRGVVFHWQEKRLRCFGHIINLIVKAFLYGTNSNTLLIVEPDSSNLETSPEELDTRLDHWRQHGPYGRLRNIITYICWTPQRREEFIQLTQQSSPDTTAFLPIAANQTRWNSDYHAINRALELRTPIELFVTRNLRNGLQEDQLDAEDWNDLKDISSVLEPFYRTTKLLEGIYSGY